MAEMKTTLYMATSINGIIARDNFSEDFLLDEDWDILCHLVKEFGNIIWGSNTYKQLQKWSEDHFTEEIRSAIKVIITRDKSLNLEEGYIPADSPTNALKVLREQNFANALLTGGSIVNSLFAKEKLIDEVLVTIDPVIVGKGIPIFSPGQFDINLSLQKVDKISLGRLVLQYKVIN